VSRRSRTPIFDALAARYREGPAPRERSWALDAYMRGFTYGLVLQDTLPPKRQHVLTHSSPWDAIDHTPNKHDPSL